MGITDAFAKYHATLTNHMWAVSAIAEDGSLVLSCWTQFFTTIPKDTMRYTDRLSRWKGNARGNKLLETHLQKGVADKLSVRLVIASTDRQDIIDRGENASQANNDFHARQDRVGSIVSFDGDEFIIDFHRQ